MQSKLVSWSSWVNGCKHLRSRGAVAMLHKCWLFCWERLSSRLVSQFFWLPLRARLVKQIRGVREIAGAGRGKYCGGRGRTAAKSVRASRAKYVRRGASQQRHTAERQLESCKSLSRPFEPARWARSTCDKLSPEGCLLLFIISSVGSEVTPTIASCASEIIAAIASCAGPQKPHRAHKAAVSTSSWRNAGRSRGPVGFCCSGRYGRFRARDANSSRRQCAAESAERELRRLVVRNLLRRRWNQIADRVGQAVIC